MLNPARPEGLKQSSLAYGLWQFVMLRFYENVSNAICLILRVTLVFCWALWGHQDAETLNEIVLRITTPLKQGKAKSPSIKEVTKKQVSRLLKIEKESMTE